MSKQTYANYILNNMEIKEVTNKPEWMIKFKGFMDSWKGRGVCNEYIEKIDEDLKIIETQETRMADKVLDVLHNTSEAIEKSLTEKQLLLTEIPKDTTENSNIDFRMREKNSDLRKAIEASMEADRHLKKEIGDAIHNVHLVLAERIRRTQRRAECVKDIYKSGTIKGRMGR